MTATADSLRSSLLSKFRLRIPSLESAWVLEVSILMGLTALALSLRLYKLGEWSFWIDEVTSVKGSTQIGSTANILSYSHPLFYLLTTPIVNQIGTSEWAMRLVPSLIGTLSIPILYLPIRRLFGPQVALLTAGFLAVSTWHLYWSQNARFYVQLMLFYNLSMLAFLLGTENGRKAYFIGSSAFFALALASHPTALLLAPTLIAYVVLVKLLKIEAPRGLIVSNLILYIGVPIVIWVLLELYRVSTFGSGATPNLDTHFFGFPNNSSLWLISTLFYYVGIVPMCLAVVGMIHVVRSRDRLGLAVSITALIPVLTIMSISFISFTASRYFFTSLVGWAVLAAIAVRMIAAQAIKRSALLAAGVILIFVAGPIGNDFLYFQYQNGNRDDWKGAFAYVEERMAVGDLVVSTRAPMGQYYLGKDVLQLGRISPEVVEQSGVKTWIVVDMTPISPTWQEWMDRNVILVEVLDVHVAARIFIMRVYLYDPALQLASAGGSTQLGQVESRGASLSDIRLSQRR